jgi:peptidoglycan-N-acetylglucosamine deacetylase
VNPWSIVVPAAAGVAAGACVWGAVYPTSELFGRTLHHTARRSAMALTFDDGPNPSITPRLLELLERHGVRATFFVVGRFARACPELVREIAARGHVIGNHTESHPNLALLSGSRIQEELTRCQDSVALALAGRDESRPEWMRPPWGFRGPQLFGAVRRAGLRGVVMWSFGCYDWRPQRAEQLVNRLGRLERLGRLGQQGVASEEGPSSAGDQGHGHGGEVVLLHDGDFRGLGADREHVLGALQYWLPRWRDQGCDFVTMNDVAGGMRA